jgi:predicted nucleotidyltransferase
VDKRQIVDSLRSHLTEFSAFGVERIAVFGSVVHGTATEESDIDILVRFSAGAKSFDHFMGLRAYLEDMFPGQRIDLVLEDALKPAIRARVLSEAADVA